MKTGVGSFWEAELSYNLCGAGATVVKRNKNTEKPKSSAKIVQNLNSLWTQFWVDELASEKANKGNFS